jgi:flavodoxin
MKALVVYDSFFGNTEQIARAIADALRTRGEVEAVRVGNVKPDQLAGLTLLVVGSPTRAFRPSPATSKFLRGIPRGSLKDVKVAAFDTRAKMEDARIPLLRMMVKLFGYAAESISGWLKRKSGHQPLAPAGFFVTGTEGPLKPGEMGRAAEWAKGLVAEARNA